MSEIYEKYKHLIIEGTHTFTFNSKKYRLLEELKKCFPEAGISINRGPEDLELIIISDRFISCSNEKRLLEVKDAMTGIYVGVVKVIKILTRKEILELESK